LVAFCKRPTSSWSAAYDALNCGFSNEVVIAAFVRLEKGLEN
jgi:hypothetical protein